jgi:hypothetical protein
MEEFRNARLVVDADAIVPPDVRERYAHLPEMVLVRDREAWIDYDVEEKPDGTLFGVARLRLPEKVARTLTEPELPALDRPMRFVVTRGQRGAVRADTLEELQEELDRPWMPDEIDEQPERDDRRSKRDRRPFRGKHAHGGSQRKHPGRGRRPRR